MKTMLIVGGSRGIGRAVAEHYASRVEQLFCVSRSPSPFGTWIPADVSKQEGLEALAEALGDRPLDGLLFLGGVWEKGAFTDAYQFDLSSSEEIDFVLAVNLVAPIKLTKLLLANLQASDDPRVLVIGSLDALDNRAGREVANSASKYGLRGAMHALQLELGERGICFTVVNPDNVATPEVIEDIETGAFGPQVPIPMEDLVKVIACTLSLSRNSYVSEVNVVQRYPGAR